MYHIPSDKSFSKLDYCNLLLLKTTQINRLQDIQNIFARTKQTESIYVSLQFSLNIPVSLSASILLSFFVTSCIQPGSRSTILTAPLFDSARNTVSLIQLVSTSPLVIIERS